MKRELGKLSHRVLPGFYITPRHILSILASTENKVTDRVFKLVDRNRIDTILTQANMALVLE